MLEAQSFINGVCNRIS